MPGKSITTGVGASEVPLPAGSWIQKTPVFVAGTLAFAIRASPYGGLVNYRRLGLTDARILEVIDGLTQSGPGRGLGL